MLRYLDSSLTPFEVLTSKLFAVLLISVKLISNAYTVFLWSSDV